MNSKLQDKIKEKIQNEKVIPKKFFVLKNIALWSLGIVSTLMGAVLFALILFIFVNTDFFIFRFLGKEAFREVLKALPLVWIVFFFSFVFIARLGLSNTEKGYKYGFKKIVLMNIMTSAFIGLGMYLFGLGYIVDHAVAKKVRPYRDVFSMDFSRWNNPEKGFLFGDITSRDGLGVFTLKDLSGNEWNVRLAEKHLPSLNVINRFDKVRVIGRKEGVSFEACRILPFRPKGLPKSRFDMVILDKDVYLQNRNERKKDYVRTIECSLAGPKSIRQNN